jgi:hypothetical protein
MDFQTSALILAWAAILLLALAMSGLLRQVHALSTGRGPRQAAGPPVGSPAPPLGPGDQERPDLATVALFVDTSCDVCTQSLRVAEELAATGAGQVRFLAVFPADADGFRQQRVEVIEHAQEAFEQYRIPLTPFGVVIGGDGRVERTSALGSEALVRQLVDDALGRR